MTETKEYLTAKEMAVILKISLGAMYRLLHSDPAFPRVMVLSDYRFIESDVKAYLEGKK